MSTQSQVINAKTLQLIMGIISCSLPLLLVLVVLIIGDESYYQPSISDFYYTKASVLFVGCLWAVGTFMIAYKGYIDNHKISDNALANILGICAIGISVFPTDKGCVELTLIGTIHLIFAGIFFILLGYMSYFRFTLSNLSAAQLKLPKIMRNRIYRIFGWVLFISLAMMIVYLILFQFSLVPELEHIIFWCETAGLLAFGFSWLTKAEIIFPD